MSPRAVVADGSLTVRMHLGEALEAAGFEVVACGSAEEARRAIAVSPPPAIVVTSASLPDACGVELAGELRRSCAPLCVRMIVCASADERAALGGAAVPGVEIVPRPCDAALIAARARAVLGLGPVDEPAGEPEPRGVSVLAVDDSATFRHRLRELLEEEGYEVVTASSGEEAIARLCERPIDGVLLDMVMPGLGGEETCRRIRATPAVRAIPILMLTSREGMEPVVAALRAGADDFVTKSDDFAILKARLRAQIRRRLFEEDNRRIREELLDARMEATKAQAERELAETRARLLDDLAAKNVELQRAKDRAEAAVRARDEFLIIASHELRTPLTPLTLHLQFLRRSLAESCKGAEGVRLTAGIEVAARQTARLATLIDALLDASRISAGRLELRPERFDLAAALRDVVGRMEEVAHRSGSTIIVQGDAPVFGTWDRLRCDQVVTNLLCNAIKYGSGKPIDVSVHAQGRAARIVVRDHGIGIADEQRARIFGIFERAVSSRNYGGLGLGLYITRQIVEAHGGTIQVESRVGEGSTFAVELPLTPEQGREPQRAA